MSFITTLAHESWPVGIFMLAALLVPRIHALRMRKNKSPQMAAWTIMPIAPKRILPIDPQGLPTIRLRDLPVNLLSQKTQKE